MLIVEERFPDGRRCVLSARAVPVGASGPVLYAVGRITVPTPRVVVDDDLFAVARAVGVVTR